MSRPGSKPTSTPLIFILFTISGASGLIYEVVWARQLTFVFGAMSHSIATVLAAYMGGLALGSFLLGRRMARGGRPLRVYAVLEAGIAVWALLLPLLLRGLDPIYRLTYQSLGVGPAGVTALRLILSFVLLLVPTTLMGGTLPVLSALAGQDRASRWAGLLYSLNTIGAVAGTLGAGFLLLPALGMRASIYVAVVLNLAVAVTGWWMSREAAPVAPAEPAGSPRGRERTAPRRGPRRAAMAIYAVSGFCALAYEVLWTRVLAGSLGTTTYAFTTMLATFLFGLALGSLWASRQAPRWADRAGTLGTIVAVTGLTALVTTPLLDRLPSAFLSLAGSWGGSFGSLTLVRFVLASLTMLPTTFLLGAVFPAAVRLSGIDEGGSRGASREIGALYAANTAGAIAGSVLTAFVIAPALGRQSALLAAALVNTAAGILLLVLVRERASAGAPLWKRRNVLAAAAAVAAVGLAVFARTPWDLRAMNAGTYVYLNTLSNPQGLEKLLSESETLFMQEDAEVTASIWRTSPQGKPVISLRINGKVDASSGGDMITQIVSGSLPMLLHPRPERALVIGLASGVTTAAVARFPVARIDCAEISPAVVAASRYFHEQNRNVLDDPRVRLLVTDGRNHLHLTDERYDVIISEPSNPWIAGLTNLFTREFFEQARDRLGPGGILCQWISIYDLSEEDLLAVLRTFRQVFPTMSCWLLGTSDLLMLGGEGTTAIDLAALAGKTEQFGLAGDLQSVGVSAPWGFLPLFVMDGAKVASITGPGRIVTDDNLALEFSAPRTQGSVEAYRKLLDLVARVRTNPMPLLSGWEPLGLSRDQAEGLAGRIYQARAILMELLAHGGAEDPSRLERLREAHALFGGDPALNRHLAQNESAVGLASTGEGKFGQAAEHFARALQVDPENPGLHYSLGIAFGRMGMDAEALAELEKAVALDPSFFDARADLGVAYARLGRMAEAAAQWRQALALRPGDPTVTANLARLGP